MKFMMLVLAFALAGCSQGSDKKAGDLAYDYQDLRAYEDKERGVTCYRVVGYQGLSCLKTKPSAKEEMENQMIREIFQPKGE